MELNLIQATERLAAIVEKLLESKKLRGSLIEDLRQFYDIKIISSEAILTAAVIYEIAGFDAGTALDLLRQTKAMLVKAINLAMAGKVA